MSIIQQFVINKTTSSLSFFSNEKDDDVIHLSFEYLRVFAPTNEKGQAIGAIPKVYHKKQVKLLAIESVAKYGYRFIFDDGHSNIYSDDYLQILASEYQQRWQNYLQSTSAAINSREATIEIKEVK